MIDNHPNDDDDKPTKGAKDPGSNPSHHTNLFSCGCKFYFYLTILSLAIMVVVVVMVMVMIMIRVMWHLKLPLNMEETSPNPLIQALL